VIRSNLKKVKDRIVSVSHTKQVRLVAVSKTRTVGEIQQAIDAGQRDFGENYLQEALGKIDFLRDKSLVWHFIGPIQSNKTVKISENFDWIHSLDRVKIAQRLSEQRPKKLNPLNVLLQINIDSESSKSGVLLAEAADIVPQIERLPNISLRGFMCIPIHENSSHSFYLMAELISYYTKLDNLSMGMSMDL
jgi:pyridoxal phosphate enzyme (YggS family)